jgi:hypothetical protein
MTLYVNGVQDKQSTSSIPASVFNTSINMNIGARNNSNQFLNGQIDDVRLFNYPLTATQVQNIYSNGAYTVAPATGAP